MNDTDIGYMAGLIDGEGSIVLNKAKYSKKPFLAIDSTDLEMLEWVKFTFGGCIVNKKKYQEHHKSAYCWRLAGSGKVIELLTLVAPHLKINKKRARALHIIYKYKACTPRNGHYTEELKTLNKEFIEEFYTL